MPRLRRSSPLRLTKKTHDLTISPKYQMEPTASFPTTRPKRSQGYTPAMDNVAGYATPMSQHDPEFDHYVGDSDG